jgi:hypothetical protein
MYTVKLITTVEPGSAGAPDDHAAKHFESIREAAAHAEQLAAPAGNTTAVFDESAGPGTGAEVARYSQASGWSSDAITPAAWWAKLSMPTKEKLKLDPYGDIDGEAWREVAEAGGVFLGAARPDPSGGSSFRLPQQLADFVDSERPRL